MATGWDNLVIGISGIGKDKDGIHFYDIKGNSIHLRSKMDVPGYYHDVPIVRFLDSIF